LLIFLSSSIKNRDILNTLKSIKSKKAKENSKPARPNIKNVIDTRFKSSFIAPVKIDKVYKVNQDISE
jgi:hypothetical protein